LAYIKVVKTKIVDSVPKTIVTMLVRKSVKISNNELISNLYHQKNYESLFEENQIYKNERKEIKSEIEMLRASLDILNEIELKF